MMIMFSMRIYQILKSMIEDSFLTSDPEATVLENALQGRRIR